MDTCPICANPLPEGARFCPNCGAVVATSLGVDERKMVTVLFADLVDSTGLAQRLDPERAREVLGRFFEETNEELEALRGRPEKFIGDAVMAVFGLPHVHEDDAIRAIRAGLAIRDRTLRLGISLGLSEPLHVRVGIESGEAATGVGPAGQLLVTGPLVNRAVRLQAAALPGEVLAGQTTHALTETAVSFGEPRAVSARGFDTNIPAFPVEGISKRSTRRTIPFVGRATELSILREHFGRAAAGGLASLITIVGEPGIGKSRLADEFVAGIDADVSVLTGVAPPHTATTTFAPVAAVVRDLAGIEDGDSPDKARRRLRDVVERWCNREGSDRIVDRLSLLFDLGEAGRDESAFIHDVQAGFVSLIEGRAGEQPVVLVLDDVQDLRPPMLDLVERLVARGRRSLRRVVVLAMARQALLDGRPSWGSNAANAVLLRLEPLPGQEAIDLVRQATGNNVAEAEAAEIAARTGGNPFFIIETTGMLFQAGERVETGPRLTVPPTVQAVIAARLDALAPRLRELVRRTSVFLYTFDLDELAVVDGGARPDELRQLEDAEILVPAESGAERWRFRHATLREVAYASLPKRERARLHESVAEHLLGLGHPIWAAHHFELAARASVDLDPDDRRIPDRAADALIDAGDRSRRRMESRSAADYYDRALALCPVEDEWGVREARALAGKGEALYWLAEYPAATAALERAVQLASEHHDAFALALALRFLGDIAINVEADVDKGEELLRRSLLSAEELGDPWAIARTLLFAGWVPWTRQRYDEAEAMWRRALATAVPDDRWARVRALTSLSINRAGMRDLDGALELIEQANAIADEAGDQFSLAVATVQKARVFEDLGRLEESLSLFDQGIAAFEELGARWELADAKAERGIAKRELGQLDEAEDDLKEAIRISEELGERQLASWTWGAFARVAERKGDQSAAAERLRRSREAEAEGPR